MRQDGEHHPGSGKQHAEQKSKKRIHEKPPRNVILLVRNKKDGRHAAGSSPRTRRSRLSPATPAWRHQRPRLRPGGPSGSVANCPAPASRSRRAPGRHPLPGHRRAPLTLAASDRSCTTCPRADRAGTSSRTAPADPRWTHRLRRPRTPSTGRQRFMLSRLSSICSSKVTVRILRIGPLHIHHAPDTTSTRITRRDTDSMTPALATHSSFEYSQPREARP